MTKAKININDDSIVEFKGKTYSIPMWADAFCQGNTDDAKGALGTLIKKGEATVLKTDSKESKAFERASKEESITDAVTEYAKMEEENKDFRAEANREGRAVYKHVEYDFANILQAREFLDTMNKNLRIKDTEIALRKGAVVLVCKNVTDQEYNIMNRAYTTDRFIGNAIGAMDTVAQGFTDGINYTGNKIIAPMVQVGAKATSSIFKTLLSTTAKVTGGLISATVQGVKDAGTEIMYDPEVLKATKDLIEVKDSAKRAVSGINMSGGPTRSGAGRIVE